MGGGWSSKTIRIAIRSYSIFRPLSCDPATGRRRSNASRDATLAATHELLEEIGFDKLSIEGVAARAGVGKATIYRWWPGKGALAMEAFLAAVVPTIEFPETSSARDDLMVQIHRVAAAYRSRAGRIVREMISLGQTNIETLHQFVAGYLEPRRTAAKEVLKRGMDKGEFVKDANLDVVVDALYGPIFHRTLCGHAPIDDKYVTMHVTLVLDSISARRKT